MIEYLSGILIKKTTNLSIVDVNGIGYRVNITNNSYEVLPDIKKRVNFLIFFHVYENGQELYGFIDDDERYLFTKLISISGIGPKTAKRIIIELKDKLSDYVSDDIPELADNNIIKDALNALSSLGYSGLAVKRKIDEILMNNPDIEIEELIKKTLNELK